MEVSNRKSVFEELNKFVPSGSGDFIEVTEWTNGEGWDIIISTNNRENRFSLQYGELEAINYLVKCLEYDKK